MGIYEIGDSERNPSFFIRKYRQINSYNVENLLSGQEKNGNQSLKIKLNQLGIY